MMRAKKLKSGQLAEYQIGLNGPLFRRQRQLLLDLMDRWAQGTAWLPRQEDVELLGGVNNLLDCIADQAHDRHGIDCLLVAEPAGHPRG